MHARFVVALDAAGRLGEMPCLTSGPSCPGPVSSLRAGLATNQRAILWQATSTGTMSRSEAVRKDEANYQGPLFVATPSLLRDYGIEAAQLGTDTDIVTSRPGLNTVPNLDLLGTGTVSQHYTPDGHFLSERYRCPPARCIARPKIRTFAGLPSGTSAPDTLITEHALQQLRQQLVPVGWLIQTPGPLTPAQDNAARRLALAAETRIETSTGQPDFSTIRTGATAAGIILALAVLASTVSLIRSEAASDLRILTAAGASGTHRRALAAATAGVLGLLGALLGTAAAYVAIIAWAWGRNSLGTTLSPVPAVDLTILLAGLPLAAAAGGWLLGGRQPPAISRKPLE
jgi:putative ABC transport system permease protein